MLSSWKWGIWRARKLLKGVPGTDPSGGWWSEQEQGEGEL